MRVYRPKPDDAAAIGRLAHRTFAETFVGKAYYTHEIIDGYAETAFRPERIAREIDDPRVQYFLLEEGAALLGYGKLVEREPAACVHVPDTAYLERLYVAEGAKGRGYGRTLLNTLFREAAQRGYRALWLSVWEHNYPAQAFYAKHGFQRVGEWDWAFESRGVRYVDLDYILVGEVPAPLVSAAEAKRGG